jgi:hypothetical protein
LAAAVNRDRIDIPHYNLEFVNSPLQTRIAWTDPNNPGLFTVTSFLMLMRCGISWKGNPWDQKFRALSLQKTDKLTLQSANTYNMKMFRWALRIKGWEKRSSDIGMSRGIHIQVEHGSLNPRAAK